MGVLYLQGVFLRLLFESVFGVLGQYSTLGGVLGSFDEDNAEAGRFSVRDELQKLFSGIFEPVVFLCIYFSTSLSKDDILFLSIKSLFNWIKRNERQSLYFQGSQNLELLAFGR